MSNLRVVKGTEAETWGVTAETQALWDLLDEMTGEPDAPGAILVPDYRNLLFKHLIRLKGQSFDAVRIERARRILQGEMNFEPSLGNREDLPAELLREIVANLLAIALRRLGYEVHVKRLPSVEQRLMYVRATAYIRGGLLHKPGLEMAMHALAGEVAALPGAWGGGYFVAKTIFIVIATA